MRCLTKGKTGLTPNQQVVGHQISSFNQQFAHVVHPIWWKSTICLVVFFVVRIWSIFFYCKDWAEFAKNLGGWMRVLYIWNILESKIQEAILLWDKWYYTYVCNRLKHSFLASYRATPHQRNILMCNAIFKYLQYNLQVVHLSTALDVSRRSMALLESAIHWHPSTIPTSLGVLDFLWFQHKNNIRHETCECIHWFTVKKQNIQDSQLLYTVKDVNITWIAVTFYYPNCSAKWNYHASQYSGWRGRSIHFAFIAWKESAKL